MNAVRPTAPFGRRAVELTAVRSFGEYTVLDVHDPEAPNALPGQFHMLSAEVGWGAGEDGRPWLPRAISFLTSDGEGGFGFLIDSVGPGTDRLTRMEPGERLLVTGPFGNGFQPVGASRRPLLLGGGIGAAPVMAAAEALAKQGTGYDLVLGFRGSEQGAISALAEVATVVTDDGSLGDEGTVIGPLMETANDSTEILACGPPAMLEAVRALAAERGLPSQLALESPMACGFGACFGCAIETKRGTLRLCVDGPVLAGDDLVAVTASGRAGAQ
ncbi:MAG: dihydroorotate dehydrogenase electron transfer subunit [Actinomycetes bacterium]